MANMKTINVIDSHTGGMPTRIIVTGGPDLGSGSLATRRERLQKQFDYIRTAVIKEPRGFNYLIGGLLCEPVDPDCAAGVIFFEGASYLGMCGHGAIGLMATLKHMGRITNGTHRLETPIGVITTQVGDHGFTSIENIPSYRLRANVEVQVPEYGVVVGDVAWGGNWYFLVRDTPTNEQLLLSNSQHLTAVTLKIRQALVDQGITGADGAVINQVELFAAPHNSVNDSRNFVLCPDGYYDRSPCGTGTSAKLACLASDGQLAEGQIWRQESIIGSVFECSYRRIDDGSILPTISGNAYVTGEANLILNPDDPFCMGI